VRVFGLHSFNTPTYSTAPSSLRHPPPSPQHSLTRYRFTPPLPLAQPPSQFHSLANHPLPSPTLHPIPHSLLRLPLTVLPHLTTGLPGTYSTSPSPFPPPHLPPSLFPYPTPPSPYPEPILGPNPFSRSSLPALRILESRQGSAVLWCNAGSPIPADAHALDGRSPDLKSRLNARRQAVPDIYDDGRICMAARAK